MSTGRSMLLLLLVLMQEGATIRPVVTFSPNYKKILTTESITMTCDGGSTTGGGPNYIWYKDNSAVHSGKSFTIHNAGTSHSGSYRCQTSTGEISYCATLDVSDGWVILQTPLHAYEGSQINIRCHHQPGYSGGQTIFYKDNKVIRDRADNTEYYIGNIDGTTAGTYRCRKVINGWPYDYEDEAFVFVKDLFSTPVLEVSPELVKEGDNMTLTCVTVLSESKQDTELRYAFYRDETNLQGFTSSNKYEDQFILEEDSGTYTCEIQTSTGRVRKKSQKLLIGGPNNSSLITILSVSLGLLLLIVIIFIFLCIYCQRRSSNNNHQPPTVTDNGQSLEGEINYTDLAMSRRQPGHLPVDNGSNVVYATVNKANKQVKASQETSNTSSDIYQNISYHR